MLELFSELLDPLTLDPAIFGQLSWGLDPTEAG
jgi:hypothetical protein